MTRRQVRIGHRLLALKQLLGNALTVDAVGQGPANPNVLQERGVEVEVYVLPDQPGVEVHFEPTAGLLVQLHRQVKCNPGGADSVDYAGEHVGDQRDGVGDAAPRYARYLRRTENRGC